MAVRKRSRGGAKKKQDEDEEIDEENAFTAEDTELVAMFGGDESEEDDLAEDDEDEEGEESGVKAGEQGETDSASSEDSDERESLLDGSEEEVDDEALRNIQKVATGRAIRKRPRSTETVTAGKEEDPAALGPRGGKVSIADLAAALEGRTQFGDLKKKLERIERSEALPVELDEPKAKRIERDVAYGKTNQTVSKWQTLVKKNRESETVKFPMNAAPKQTPSTANLATSFRPETATEEEIERILRESGMAGDRAEAKNEDLELRQFSKEEVEVRRRELAKMKSLMFYYEKKMKRIKKIKSKKFRKTLKKEREKATTEAGENRAVDDEEYAVERAVERERQRAEERMSLRHRNTSKWIKRQIRKGTSKYDEGSKQAITEQLTMASKLREKQSRSNLADGGAEESDGDSANSEHDGEDPLDQGYKAKSSEEGGEGGEKRSKLFSLKFMQRAQEKRREAVGELLKEVDDDGDTNAQGGEEALNGRRLFASREDQLRHQGEDHVDAAENAGAESATEEELQNIVEENRRAKEDLEGNARRSVDLSASTLPRRGVKLQSQGFVDMHDASLTQTPDETGEDAPQRTRGEEVQVGSPFGRHAVVTSAREKNLATDVLPNLRTKTLKTGQERENPWLREPESATLPPPRKQDGGKKEKARRPGRSTPVEAAPVVQVNQRPAVDAAVDAARSAARMEGKSLIRAAFAGAGAEEEDFEKSKNKEIESKLPKAEDVGAVVLPGWGAWGGQGARKKRSQSRYALEAMEKLQKARADAISKRADSKPQLKHVVLSEKRLSRAAHMTVPTVPFPFKSAAQYEKSLTVPVGKEWVAPTAHRAMIRPKVETRMGSMIDPIKFGGEKGKAKAARRKPLAG